MTTELSRSRLHPLKSALVAHAGICSTSQVNPLLVVLAS